MTPEVIVLGSSYAIPTPEADNTHLAVLGRERTVLVDCGTNPIVGMEKAGIDHDRVTDVILTHFHPDHVSGVPLMLMDLWLLGRRKPLTIYGLHHTIDRIEAMMTLYGWEEWPHFFPVGFVRLPAEENSPVFECDEMRIFASPVHHFIPNIGLRFEFPTCRKSLAYSCDTEPCDEITRLANGVDVLLHEATGAVRGHSSAAQAAEIALKAKARKLVLIHYPSGIHACGDPVKEAQNIFPGEVRIARDFMKIELGN